MIQVLASAHQGLGLKDNNADTITKIPIHRIARKQFLIQLSQLPQRISMNELKKNQQGLVWDLGILHVFELIQLFSTLTQTQKDSLPHSIKQKIKQNPTYCQKPEQKAKMIIQQLKQVQLMETDGYILKNSQCSIIDHRLLCQLLLQLRPNQFKVGKILYFDQKLTGFQRSLYNFSQQQYQRLCNLQQLINKPKIVKNQLNYKNSLETKNCQLQKNQQNQLKNIKKANKFIKKDKNILKSGNLIQKDDSKSDKKYQNQATKSMQVKHVNETIKSPGQYVNLQDLEESSEDSVDSRQLQKQFLRRQRYRLYETVMNQKVKKRVVLFKARPMELKLTNISKDARQVSSRFREEWFSNIEAQRYRNPGMRRRNKTMKN